MIDFMVIGAPRSGTAWAANWLTTEHSLCWHDVLFRTTVDEIDRHIEIAATGSEAAQVGIADTGIWMFPEFLRKHPARKVILHRDIEQINDSLLRAGLDRLLLEVIQPLNDIDGLHVDWTELFNRPDIIHTYLFGKTVRFNTHRHRLLAHLNVQMDFEKLDPDPHVTATMLRRMSMGIRG